MRQALTLLCVLFCLTALPPAAHAQSSKGLSGQLLAAVNASHAAQVRDLLRRGANPDARRYESFHGETRSWTALMEAATLGDYPAVQALLASGARVNARGYTCQTGAPRGEGDYRRSTALIEACLRSDNDEVVSALLAHGASVNAADKSGSTALSYTLWLSDWHQAQVLIAHGARTDRKTRRLIAERLALTR